MPASSCSNSSGPGYASRMLSHPWSATTRPSRIASAVGLDADAGTGRQRHSSRGVPSTTFNVRTSSPCATPTVASRAPNDSKRNGTTASATSVGRAAAERLAPSRCSSDAFRSRASERSRAARSASCARRNRRSDVTRAAVKSASIEREHAAAEQDRKGGPVGDVAPAGDDDPAATAELERADGAGARPVARREDLRAAEADASANVLREVRETRLRACGARTTRSRRRPARRSPASGRTPVGRPETRSTDQEGNGAREDGTPGRLRPLDRLPTRRIAQQVEAEHGASRARLGPDGDDGDVGRAAPARRGRPRARRAPRSVVRAPPRTPRARLPGRSRRAPARRSHRSTRPPAPRPGSSRCRRRPPRPRAPPPCEGSSGRARRCSGGARRSPVPPGRPRRAPARRHGPTGATRRRRSRPPRARRARHRRASASRHGFSPRR